MGQGKSKFDRATREVVTKEGGSQHHEVVLQMDVLKDVYRLGRKLGGGCYAEVYHAVDTRDNSEVAIKFLPRGLTLNPAYVAREILNHEELSHPHIIGFKEVFLAPTHLCIAMEYAPGGTLREYLTLHRIISEERARWFFQQLLLAVDFCHRKCIVIRDIKLTNILLNEAQDRIMLCDFGFSKHCTRDPPATTMLGTDIYMPPELLLSSLLHRSECSQYNAEKVDMWTCGVTLYTMLVGRNPFYGVDEQGASRIRKSLTRMILFSKSMKNGRALKRMPQPLTEECCDFLIRILDPNPDSRISLQEAQEHPWFRKNLPSQFDGFNDAIVKESKELKPARIYHVNELVRLAQGTEAWRLAVPL